MTTARRRRARLDAEMRSIGFHGYEGCPWLDEPGPGCPTPYMCSEKGDCHSPPPARDDAPQPGG